MKSFLRVASTTVLSVSCALLAACASVFEDTAPLATVAVTEAPATVGRAQALAPGVFMVRGADGEVGPANRGRTGNAGFIVGPDGVIVIDTGVSYRQAEALMAEVARMTTQPIRLVLVTHARQEFVFGAQAFRDRGIPVHMQRQAAQLMAARCDNCLKTLRRVLGDEEMAKSTMFTPDISFEANRTLSLIGRPVDVIQFGHSSGPGDIVVFDRQSGVLFAGGLMDRGVVPDVQDANIRAWYESLDQLNGLPIRAIVPGHGPAGGPALIGVVQTYLKQLQARMLELLKKGASLSEAAALADLPDYRQWDQYDTIHRRNASIVYLQLERDQLFK